MSRMRILSVIAGVLLALVVLAPRVRAADEVATQISIRPIDPVTVGIGVRVTVDLTKADGTPLANAVVTLATDAEPGRRTRTDIRGVAMFRLPPTLAPGGYVLIATYAGETDAYLGATTGAALLVVPFDLTVETVPPLPGMVFELDGTRFVAGADGVARIPVDVAGDHELAVLEDAYREPDRRAAFSRWNTERFGPRISIQIPYAVPLQAGFEISSTASQSFLDLEGGEVDRSRVTSLTLRSSIGTVVTYPDGEARWYKASRVVRRATGLESVEVRYSVDSVEVDGSNVVNSGQQSFLVHPRDTWKIELLLFSAHLTAGDALFGFAIGRAVDVAYPNGTVVRVESDENGELSARWLARGIYRMTVAGAPGWSPVMPVALSRDQDVQLKVISYLDMAVAAIAAVGLALGLLHIGRPHLVPGTIAGAGRRVGRLVRLPGPMLSRVVPARRMRALPENEPVGSAGAAILVGDPTPKAPDDRLLPVVRALALSGVFPPASRACATVTAAALHEKGKTKMEASRTEALTTTRQPPNLSRSAAASTGPISLIPLAIQVILDGPRQGSLTGRAGFPELESCPSCGLHFWAGTRLCRRCRHVLGQSATLRSSRRAERRRPARGTAR